MTIGFDGSRANLLERTGTENYSYQLLKHLLQIDRKNNYVIYTRNTIPWLRFWTQVGLALQTFKDNLDVLFVPAHTLPIIRKPGLKTVMTVHDLGVEYLPKMHQLKQQLYLKYITRYQLASATGLIAVSKATKEDLVKRAGINPEKISVVYEGYDKKLFKPVKQEIVRNRLKYFDIEVGKYFLFVGTIQPRKNLERLIQAFSKTTGTNLVIAGSKGWLSEAIYKLPRKLSIEDRVKFLGYVPEKDLPALYSGAQALVFPSLFEGFGLPILEAQACGCPVITSNISSMPEVAGKGALYVNPYSVDDIVKGMERVQSTGYRVQLIKNGFENIKRFSWEKCAAQTLEVLESV